MSEYRLGVCTTVVAIAASAALPAAAHLGSVKVKTVAGKPSEFRFTVTPKAAPKGTVVFSVTNKGTIPHDFRIKGKQTPLLTAGKSATLRIVFAKPGSYPYLCTVPGHAAAGMKGVFKVT
jgi:uncharacterized cupredoxin-like copper-binding protein